jgi:hypothetical protein
VDLSALAKNAIAPKNNATAKTVVVIAAVARRSN